MNKRPLLIIAFIFSLIILAGSLFLLLNKDTNIATSGPVQISQSEFNNTYRIQAQNTLPGGKGIVPDPPDFKQCTEQLNNYVKQQGGTLAKTASQATLLSLCKSSDKTITGQAMTILIKGAWLKREIDRQNITVSDQEINKEYARQASVYKGGAKAYTEYLSAVGASEDDAKASIRNELLKNKLTATMPKPKGVAATEKQISDIYKNQPDLLAKPASRNLNIVITKSKSSADKAAQQLKAGDSINKVAQLGEKLNVPLPSGAITDLSQKQVQGELSQVIFSAPQNQVVGPKQVGKDWIVFEVTKKTNAEPVPPFNQQTKAKIKSLIMGEIKSAQAAELNKTLEARYRPSTTCAKGYIITMCSNWTDPSRKQSTKK